MPVPPFSGRAAWLEAARAASMRTANAEALQRHGLTGDVVDAVLRVEVDGADARGRSLLRVQDVAAQAGVPERTVRLLRAGLANSGLLSLASESPPWLQLQTPRGTA